MMSQLHQQLQQQQQMNEGIISNQNIGGGMQNQNGPKMRDNLHFAADNVSSAMSSLVRELNTGAFHEYFIDSFIWSCSIVNGYI